MKISLLTDAPQHNLALMKISAYHKQQGDVVTLDTPLGASGSDLVYGSWLFERSEKCRTDIEGGPGIDPAVGLPLTYSMMRPDYDLFGLDFSLGYSWAHCGRRCGFCKVKEMNWVEGFGHQSIWEFHDPRFRKICLLNNNTFMDPRWKETFAEIWDAELMVIDQNGYDLRLLDDEKAAALKKTRFVSGKTRADGSAIDGYIHFAWDRIVDEEWIRRGLEIARRHHLRAIVYVLIGYDTTEAEDIHRCQVIHDHGFSPFPMPYRVNPYTSRFRKFINLRYYRAHGSIGEAWRNFNRVYKTREVNS